jgi:RNA polymerase sigma-70 factor (ECF subfamily)
LGHRLRLGRDFRISGTRGCAAGSNSDVALVAQQILERGPVLRSRREAAVGADDPDGELVERWRAGDEVAFETLVRRHERRVFGLALRMLGSREEAEDVAQEVFLNLHRSGHRFRKEARFSTFVYRVAVNAALNRRRSLRRRQTRLEGLMRRQESGDDLPYTPRGPEDFALGNELWTRLQREILELGEALRAPLVLHDVEGLPYAEISNILGVAEGTVKSRIHRARRALRRQLGNLSDHGEP